MTRAAVVQAAVTVLAAVTLQAMPARAAASEPTPQPKYEAPARPIPPSQATALEIGGFRDSWLNRALGLQYELSGDVGLRNAPFIGTHNSFNSVAEMGQTISTSDANQQLSIIDQLRLRVRSLELDLHWFRRPVTGRFAPVVCHAFPNHLGCSTEKPLGPVLHEVKAWLERPAHSDQVLFLYLEDHLDNRRGYRTAAAVIRHKLAGHVYAPSGGDCRQLPLRLTRDRILREGKQVVIVGNTSCGIGSAWPSKVFGWETHLETRIRRFSDFPDCGSDFSRTQYESKQIRYYEDGRPSQVGQPRITSRVSAQMARCGVDLIGLDQLEADDARLRAQVWSWARGEPRGGGCAAQRSRPGSRATRWRALPCKPLLHPACRRGRQWLVGGRAVSQQGARAQCRTHRARFAVPRTGYEAQLLRVAMRNAEVDRVWLGYRKRHGSWVPLDTRNP